MKKKIFVILLPLFLTGCYSSQYLSVEPYNPRYSFWDRERLLANDMEDGVSVSLGFDEYFAKQFIMDIIIENNTDTTINFNPSDVYVFCYQTDSTLLSALMYQPLQINEVLDGLDEYKRKENGKIVGNIFLGVFCLVSAAVIDEAISTSDNPSIFASEAVWLGNEIVQAGLSESSFKSARNVEDIGYRKEFYSNEIMHEVSVPSGDYRSGKLHLQIPYSPLYKIYVPINGRVLSYTFSMKE